MPDMFKNKAFDIEHALNMYANGFVILPAFLIYDDEKLETMMEIIKKCHIYFIGLLPIIENQGVIRKGPNIVTQHAVAGLAYDLEWPIPEGCTFGGNDQTGWYFQNESGQRFFPAEEAICARLSNEYQNINFKVLYIGQAYGDGGKRNALHRLRKHETLQKISITGIPAGQTLNVLMIEVEPNNKLITVMNPWADDQSQSSSRIANGLDKLFNTSEAERTTLYEASFIRYFRPHFNTEFKNSFPSTNMKLLADCYRKDISAIISELHIDEIPFRLFSDNQDPKLFHTALHDLHSSENRKVFFSR